MAGTRNNANLANLANQPTFLKLLLVCAGEGILEKGRLVGKVGGKETNKCPVPFTSYVQIWKCKGS